MLKYLIFSLLLIGVNLFGQNEAAYVKQTQFGSSLDNLVVHPDNPIFTKFVKKKEGLEIHTKKGNFLVYNDEIDVVQEKENSYRYEFRLQDMDLALFFTPYPMKNSLAQMYMCIALIPGLNQNNKSQITVFKMVLLDELVK